MAASSGDSAVSPESAAALGLGGRVVWCLATGLGLGMARFAPGTWGTLPGLPVALGVHSIDGRVGPVACLVGLALLAVPIATWGERFFGSKDPHPVVIDEIVGMPITAAFAPPSLLFLAVGFLLNRALDIIKPFPARTSQRLPRGWGIVVDDVISSAYAGLLLWLVNNYAGGWLAARLPAWCLRSLV